MTIINAVRQHMMTCPHLSEFAKGVNVDFLSDQADSYSIEEVPCNPIIKRYIDGSSLRRFEFIFASRESYGQDVLQNIENSGFYENFASWIEEQTFNHVLPDLQSGSIARKLECTSTGYAFQTDIDKARYQIQLRLSYFQPKIQK